MNDVLIILLPTLFFGSIFSTIAGSGLGIILLIVFTIFFDVHLSIVLSSLLGFIVHPVKLFHFYKHINWRIVRWYIALGVPLSYFGGHLLFDVPQRELEVAISIALLIFLGTGLTKYKFTVQPTNRNVLIWGAINGLQAGVLGLGNIIRNPVMLAFGLRKEYFLGTASVISLSLNIAKSIAYIPNVDWTRDITIMLAASVLPIVLGITLGKRLHKYISDKTFENLLLLVIFAGVVKLLVFS